MTESECLPVITPAPSLQQQHQQHDMANYRTTSVSSDSTPLQVQDTLPTASKVDSTQTTSAITPPKTLHVRIVPNIENPSRALIFEILDRELAAGSVIKLGRFTDRPSGCVECMSFKSKVVSRSHCEIWVHSDGKLYIRDTNSSSGTFLNHIRLSAPGQESPATEIQHGDIVQLGVDYQGGEEEIYRSVKMRFELNMSRKPRPLSFSMSQFNNLMTLSRVASSHSEDQQVIRSSMVIPIEEDEPTTDEPSCSAPAVATTTTTSNAMETNDEEEMPEVDECSICLYALAPLQALFVAPCSHSFHFMCIRSLLNSYPGFQCPICRSYSDLEASVALEPEEVMAKFGLRCKSFVPPPETAFASGHQQPSNDNHPTTTTTTTTTPPPCISKATTSSPSCSMQVPADPSPTQQPSLTHLREASPRDRRTVFVESDCSIIRDASPRDRRTVFVDSDVNILPSAQQPLPQQPQQQPEQSQQQQQQQQQQQEVQSPQPQQPPSQPQQTPQPRPRSTTQRRSEKRLSAANIMEKLKLTLFEKRKFTVAMRSDQQQQQQQQQQQRGYKRSNRTRPLSYPNFLMRHSHRDDDTSQPEQQRNNDLPSTSTLSRHQSSLPRSSNSQLSQIQEESEDLSRREPMVVDICT